MELALSASGHFTFLNDGHSVRKDMPKSVLVERSWISLTEVGREFQAWDAAAGNTRSPMVARRDTLLADIAGLLNNVIKIVSVESM